MSDPGGTSSPPQADEPSRRWPLIGRSRGFWRLTDAADYNRYGHDLLPGWAQALLGAAGVGLAGLFVWRASSPGADDGFWRVLAYMLPVILIAIVLLIRAGGPEDSD